MILLWLGRAFFWSWRLKTKDNRFRYILLRTRLDESLDKHSRLLPVAHTINCRHSIAAKLTPIKSNWIVPCTHYNMMGIFFIKKGHTGIYRRPLLINLLLMLQNCGRNLPLFRTCFDYIQTHGHYDGMILKFIKQSLSEVARHLYFDLAAVWMFTSRWTRITPHIRVPSSIFDSFLNHTISVQESKVGIRMIYGQKIKQFQMAPKWNQALDVARQSGEFLRNALFFFG